MTSKDITRISIMCALTIIGAYIAVPLPNAPFTLQTFFAMLSGLVLSRRNATLSQFAYLFIGLVGIPVFTNGGGGLGYIFSPTFGYLLTMPFIAFMSATIKGFSKTKTYILMYIIVITSLLIGGIWLVFVAGIYKTAPVSTIIFTVFLYYFPIEIAKATLALLIHYKTKNIIPE